MGKIRQLSLHEAQKIAAGEVVERPANVVKELIENSIDAGATRIDIHIQDGGQSLIRVVDDGCGMSTEDAHACFDHHATSKISSVDDVPYVESFGFRGEALASIAAVASITLITKEENQQCGIRLERDPYRIIAVEEVASPRGTDITVRDIFFNIPARKKFLKSPSVENRHINQLVQAFCFDYPSIHFILTSDNHQVYNCPPVSHSVDRIKQLWSLYEANNTITLQNQNSYASINGIISNHQLYRYDRYHQYFFVNKRWIRNHQLAQALSKGYAHVIPEGRYPVAIIYISINPEQVDINIHPRKQEVQFLHSKAIEQLLQKTVKQALEQHTAQYVHKVITSMPSNPAREVTNNKPQQTSITQQEISEQFTMIMSEASILGDPLLQPVPDEYRFKSAQQFEQASSVAASYIESHSNDFVTDRNQVVMAVAPKQQSIEQSGLSGIVLRGQLKKTYILVEDEKGLLLIDQHAAHERILYEKFSQRFEQVATVDLVFPEVVNLTAYELALYREHAQLFNQCGVLADIFGEQQIVIRSIPVHATKVAIKQLVLEMIACIDESLKEHNDQPQESLQQTLHNRMQAQMACKAAIKAGDVLHQEQMIQLLSDLYATSNRFSCPHGRPVLWLFSFDEIERKFKRKR